MVKLGLGFLAFLASSADATESRSLLNKIQAVSYDMSVDGGAGGGGGGGGGYIYTIAPVTTTTTTTTTKKATVTTTTTTTTTKKAVATLAATASTAGLDTSAAKFEKGVWTGAYAFGAGSTMVERVFLHNEKENENFFREAIARARNEALSPEAQGWDSRLGAQRFNDPNFPAACKIAGMGKTSSPCVYLYNTRGAADGAMLPLVPDSASTPITSARCIKLDNEATFSAQGQQSKYFREGKQGSGKLIFESMRLQGKVAVEIYDNDNCQASSPTQVATFNQQSGMLEFKAGTQPARVWRMSNWEDNRPDPNDKLFVDLSRPSYADNEPVCLCPDKTGYYPPVRDELWLSFYTALAKQGLIGTTHPHTGAALTNAQKIGLLRYLMNPSDPLDVRMMVLEDALGADYQAALKKKDLTEMAEVKRQAYDAIFNDGPSNLQFPFPYACSSQFVPVQLGMRSMKIVTKFEPSEYSEALCGKNMALESLQAALEGAQKNTSLEAIAKEVQAAKTEGDEIPYNLVASSSKCIDHADCDEVAEVTNFSKADCEKKMSALGATKLDLVGYKLKQLCKVRCNAC